MAFNWSLLRIIIFMSLWILVCVLFIYVYESEESLYDQSMVLGVWSAAKIQRFHRYWANLNETSAELPWQKVIEPRGAELLDALSHESPNIPYEYWQHHRNGQSYQLNASCAVMANLNHLPYHNNYWQHFRNGNVSFYLYGAYYDCRAAPVVRVLTMANTTQETFPESFCHLWFEQGKVPAIVPVKKYSIIWQRHWHLEQKHAYPYQLTCEVPNEHRTQVPKLLSLVSAPCENATNALKVHYDPLPANETKQLIAVCVKGLDYPHVDLSARLIEWFELLRLVGAQKVFAYEYAVHANMSKVLQYYQTQEFLELLPASLATGAPRLPLWQHYALQWDILNGYLNELIYYNDCFYRHMYRYEYLALFDIDEVIVPVGNSTKWSHLIEEAKREFKNICPLGISGICFPHALFPSQAPTLKGTVPDYMHILQHTLRIPEHSDPNSSTKCFHNTSSVITVHNHFHIEKLEATNCGDVSVYKGYGQLQHYRKYFSKEQEEEEQHKLIEDLSVWKYKDQLWLNTREVLKELKFLQ